MAAIYEARCGLDPASESAAKLAKIAVGCARSRRPYLPEGMNCNWQNGSFDLDIAAHLLPVREGGQSLSVVLTDFALHDGEGDSIARFDAIRLIAPRIDPTAGLFEFKEAVVEGLELTARKSSGNWWCLSVKWSGPPHARNAWISVRKIWVRTRPSRDSNSRNFVPVPCSACTIWHCRGKTPANTVLKWRLSSIDAGVRQARRQTG